MHSVVRRAAWRAMKAGRRAAGGTGGAAGGTGGAAGGTGGAAGGTGDSPLRRLVREAAQFGEAARGEDALQWATQPYAQRPHGDGDDAGAGRVDPRDACVWLFPGQGAQFPGMGRLLASQPAARDVYGLASDLLGWDVLALCVSGSAEALAARAQAAVLVTALAGAAALRDERPALAERAAAAAGYSLGELAALTWAGALPLADAVRLVDVRERASRAAAAARRSAMLCVWLAPGARLDAALAAARDAARSAALPEPCCQVATYLYANCRVVAGDEQCVAWVEREGGAWGVRRAARVGGVCGAFHTPLMEAAARELGGALAAARVSAPRLRVLSALDVRVVRDAADVRRRVARALVAPARWEHVLHALFARARHEPQPRCVLLPPHAHTRTHLRMVNARAWDTALAAY